MGIHSWKKTIAIGVLIAFIGIGVVWAMEQGTPQFREKAGTPIIKKHKKFPWLIALLGAAAVGVGVYFLTREKTKEQEYSITVNGRSVENIDEVVGGEISFKLDNNTIVSGSNSSNFTFKGSNRIIDAAVSGQGDYFPNDLIFRDADTGALLGWKDAKGFSPFTVNNGQKVLVEYIKKGFDIELYKRCLHLSYPSYGTVIRYKQAVVDIGIMNCGQEPSATDIKNLTDFVRMYNDALKGKMRLNYVGKINALLTDGITYGISIDSPAMHTEYPDGNAIKSSNFSTMSATPSQTNFGIVLGEGDGAAAGRGDGGNPTNPYVDYAKKDFTVEGKRVIHLHYCLPNGYSPNGSAVSTTLSSATPQIGSLNNSGSMIGGRG